MSRFLRILLTHSYVCFPRFKKSRRPLQYGKDVQMIESHDGFNTENRRRSRDSNLGEFSTLTSYLIKVGDRKEPSYNYITFLRSPSVNILYSCQQHPAQFHPHEAFILPPFESRYSHSTNFCSGFRAGSGHHLVSRKPPKPRRKDPVPPTLDKPCSGKPPEAGLKGKAVGEDMGASGCKLAQATTGELLSSGPFPPIFRPNAFGNQHRSLHPPGQNSILCRL